jgi:hypothetical protein
MPDAIRAALRCASLPWLAMARRHALFRTQSASASPGKSDQNCSSANLFRMESLPQVPEELPDFMKLGTRRAVDRWTRKICMRQAHFFHGWFKRDQVLRRWKAYSFSTSFALAEAACKNSSINTSPAR